MFDPGYIQVIAVIAIIIAVLALLVFIARRIRRVPPNEALIIVGRGAGRAAPGESPSGQRVIIGGRTFVWPVLQQGFAISLEQRQIGITVEGVDKNRIKIAIKASINFKVSGTEEGVRRAEALRRVIERLGEGMEARIDHVTLSLGVAAMPESGITREALLAAADSALYSSKRAGRNRVNGVQPNQPT